MPSSTSYDRYGLTGNPFRDLASESLADVELLHVYLQADDTLRVVKEEVLEKENKAFIALVGNHGTGKTERLLLAASEGRARKAFVVYLDITDKSGWVIRGLAAEMQRVAGLGGFAQIFSAPAWYREIAPLTKIKDRAYDPIAAGKAIGRALNANAPAFLLLNDLHNLRNSPDGIGFMRVLEEVSNVVKPGVLVMFGAYPELIVSLAKNTPALSSRINRTLILTSFSDDEAALLLAKRLLAKRLIENLDPLYPFDREAIQGLNAAAYGNPRRLLELADRALEHAVRHRAYRIDIEVVRAILQPPSTQEVYDSIPVPSPAEGGTKAPKPVATVAGRN
jgi:type II secretory pathway predicted ATPase ExeA